MKCLIVEDDPYLSFLLSENFAKLDCEAQFSQSIADATRLLQTQKFDVIILDQYLPDGTSNDLSILAATSQPNCRVILLRGAYADPKSEHATIAPGVDWVLSKPVSMPDLNALIDYAALDRAWHPTAAFAMG